MKVEVQDLSLSRKRMLIEAAWDEVKDDYKDIVKGFSNFAVPGFRPGKAPRDIIEQRFAGEILEEVRSRCARRLWREALDKHEISMAGVAEISGMDFKKGEGFKFTAEFDFVPEFKLPAYTDLDLSESSNGAARRDEISRYLLENTEVEVPASFVDREMGPVEAEDTGYQKARQAAEARAKLMIILKRIAREAGLKVDDRDMDERIVAIAKAQGTTPGLLRNDLSAKGGLARLRDFMLAEMVLDYLLEKAR